MADDTDNTGLGVIVGILAVVVVLMLAGVFGPRLFRSGDGQDVTLKIEAPAEPAPSGE